MLVSPPLYSSSNGDRWRLVTDEATRRVLVRHEANAASGGRVTDMEAADFLRIAGAGPEHVAVRAAIEASSAPGVRGTAGASGVPDGPARFRERAWPRLQALVDEAVAAGLDPAMLAGVLDEVLAGTGPAHRTLTAPA